jgi:hypothetical protein
MGTAWLSSAARLSTNTLVATSTQKVAKTRVRPLGLTWRTRRTRMHAGPSSSLAPALAKEHGPDATALLQSRQTHSVAVLQEIWALHYLSSQWVKLERFVTSGHLPIDNNGCENSIRPFVIGRRNWLFADTVAGANASANLYSLLETCKVNGVDG